MKYILQIPAHLYIGGVEKVARDIGMVADPNEYEVHYIVFDDDIGEYGRELVAHGCKVFHLSEPSAGYKQYLQGLKRIMTETKYDVVHAHTMFNIGWAMLIAKQMGVPVRVAHAHSTLNNGHGVKKAIYEAAMRLLILFNSTDLVACGEKAGIRLFGKRAYLKKGKLILNGIDTDQFRYSEEKRKLIREQYDLGNRFVIGHVGHLQKVKNQSFLLDLIPALLKRKPDAMLLLLGEGEDRQMLEEKVTSLGLQDHVIMTGNVSNVSDFLSAMDVFAFPSLFEGMPLSIIEVQANGLPCVISDQVPKDVFLTDLIHPLSLQDHQERWIELFCNVRRDHAEGYADNLKKSGFDVSGVMRKIYHVYSKAERHG